MFKVMSCGTEILNQGRTCLVKLSEGIVTITWAHAGPRSGPFKFISDYLNASR